MSNTDLHEPKKSKEDAPLAIIALLNPVNPATSKLYYLKILLPQNTSRSGQKKVFKTSQI